MGEEKQEGKQFERIPPARPGQEVLRRRRRPRIRLRMVPNVPAFFRFLWDVVTRTPFLQLVSAFVVLYLLFSLGIYLAEHGASGTSVNSYGDALFTAVAGFSTSGIANPPVTTAGKALCGTWMALGAGLYFGIVIATVTAYFMLPMRRPSKDIVGIVQYNLEKLDALSLEELETLKETTMRLIDVRIEQVKRASSS
jgi:voltage-gated potassium channel